MSLRRLAFVLWNGNLGGAERLTMELCLAIQRLGLAEASVVFVEQGHWLATQLDCVGIDHSQLGLPRGRSALRCCRRLVRELSLRGPDGSVLVHGGYLAAAARLGGYREALLNVEHGSILLWNERRPAKRFVDRVSLTVGARALDGTIAVSDFVLEEVRRHPHPRVVERVHNGVDLKRFKPDPRGDELSDRFVIGMAGRLIPGKGTVEMVRALRPTIEGVRAHLLIAGDGPLHAHLEQLVVERGLSASVSFAGVVADMESFWSQCDIAVHVTNGLRESFGLVVAEAMACGLPAIVSSEGALGEVVENGVTGTLVPAGDIEALWSALSDYARDPSLRQRHGVAARARCEAMFDVAHTARRYVSLLDTAQSRRRGRVRDAR